MTNATETITVPGGGARPGTFALAMLLLGCWIVVYNLSLLRRGAFDADAYEDVSFGPGARRIGTLSLVYVVYAVWSIAYTDIPLGVVGIGDLLPVDVLVGLGLGVGLAVAMRGVSAGLEAIGVEAPEHFEAGMDVMTPETAGQWVVALVVVYPLVAIGEELVFRGGLVGGLYTGWGLSLWMLVGLSSVLFGLAHVWQGSHGVILMVVTGLVLAAALVLTGALLVPIVAHYFMNVIALASNASGIEPWPTRDALTPS